MVKKCKTTTFVKQMAEKCILIICETKSGLSGTGDTFDPKKKHPKASERCQEDNGAECAMI